MTAIQNQIPIVFAGAGDSELPIILGAAALVALGVVLLVLLGITPLREKPLGSGFLRALATGLFWFMILLVLIFFFLFGLLFFLAIVAIALIYFRRRRARQQAMLWGLAVSAERGIPLTPAIEAFAAEHWGPPRWNARALARLVAAGTPLPEALAFVGGMVPRESLVPIRVGQDLGSLSAGLRQATAPPGPQQIVWDQLAGRVAYLCLVILWTAGVSTFMLIKIAPAFQKIFADFGAQLPAISSAVIGIIPSLAIPLELLVLAVFVLFFYVVFRYLGIMTSDLPLMGRITRKLDSATVLESLALAAERNQPFPRTIATLARCYPKWSIRWRLQGVLVDVTTGTDWAESLAARGLISRADRALLQAAQRVGNLPWALREAADGMRRRLAYRFQAWLQILFPAAIVSLALVVMAFWTAFFLPLIALIQRLT